MGSAKKYSNGSYRWDCDIDTDYHRKSVRGGIWGVLTVCAVVFAVYFVASRGSSAWDDWWIPLIVIGVVLVIALPLLLLWNSAQAPREQYAMDENGVKSGYGKTSIYSDFKKTKAVVVTARYIEMTGRLRANRVYVPPEDMDFVREFILKRVPDSATVRYE